VYLFSEEGESVVLEASDKLQEVARNKIDGRIMASPAIVGKTMFLRTDTHLYRIEQARDVDKAAAR
jgi:outer membrane protein assembly factor BamB